MVAQGRTREAAEAYAIAHAERPDPITEQKLRALTPTPAPAPVPRILLDVPAWIGKSADDFRAAFGDPFSTSRIQPNTREGAPSGGEDRVYQLDWGFLTVTLENGRANGFFLNPERSKPSSYEEALRAINFPTSQPPARTGSQGRQWDNLQGYAVRITADSPGGATGKSSPGLTGGTR